MQQSPQQFRKWYPRLFIDENHFQVITPVEISDQFFGWLLGFGKKVKILDPEPVIEDFKAYLDKIRDMY